MWWLIPVFTAVLINDYFGMSVLLTAGAFLHNETAGNIALEAKFKLPPDPCHTQGLVTHQNVPPPVPGCHSWLFQADRSSMSDYPPSTRPGCWASYLLQQRLLSGTHQVTSSKIHMASDFSLSHTKLPPVKYTWLQTSLFHTPSYLH